MVQGLRSIIGAALLVALVLLLVYAGLRGRRPHEGPTTYLGHMEELRTRILWSFGAIVAGAMFAFSFRLGPDPAWLPRPALHDTLAAQIYGILAAHLVPAGVAVVALRPMEALSAELTVALLFGAVVAAPVLLGHAVAFFAPALHAHEARALRRALVPTVLLFLAGSAFGVAFVAPRLLEALYGYAHALEATAFIGASDLIGFAATMVLVFGIAFETPLVMAVLSRTGLVAPTVWIRYWRHATVGIVIVMALVTDGTIVTLALVTLPVLGLYFLGVAAARWAARTPAA